eukprot:964352-Amphidinium_carterae.1
MSTGPSLGVSRQPSASSDNRRIQCKLFRADRIKDGRSCLGTGSLTLSAMLQGYFTADGQLN